jgi:dienelactone hydrolase
VLLIHGTDDEVVPVSHLGRLAQVTEAAGRPAETLVIEGGQHSWLYEFPVYRRTVAGFLARALGGPLAPEDAAARAEAVDARRLPDTVRPPTQIELEPGGFRSLVRRAAPAPPTNSAARAAPAARAEAATALDPADPIGTEIAG